MDTNELNEILKILSSKKVSQADIKFLYDKYRTINFFKSLIDKNKKSIVYELLSSLKLHSVGENEVVFYKGDRSNCFYILIQGEVRVLLADSSVERKECEIPGFFDKNKADKRFFVDKINKFAFKTVSKLQSGQAFGELGILHDKPRMATVISTAESLFAVINADDFKRILEPTMMADSEEKLKYLKLFLENDSPYEELWRLTAYFTKLNFSKSQIIFNEGENFKKLYFIATGFVKLEKRINVREVENLEAIESRGYTSISSSRFPNISQNQNQKSSNQIIKKEISENYSIEPKEQEDNLRKGLSKQLGSQSLVIFGQNQFLGFKEVLENKLRYCFSAVVVESGIGYAIDVENIEKCFAEFPSFRKNFVRSSTLMREHLNVI